MFNKNRKIPYIKFLPIIAISLILFKVINNTGALLDGIKYVFSLLSYLIWGFAIAYFLNPVMVFIEKKLKVRRLISICIIYFLIAVILFVSVIFITPRLVENVKQLVDNMPVYIENTEVWVDKAVNELKRFDKYNMEEFIEQKPTNYWIKPANFLTVQ